MADFFEKAKAIWSALDDMVEKNPEKYAKFIRDQLHGEETQEMLKQLKLETPCTSRKADGLPNISQHVQKKNVTEVPNAMPSTSAGKQIHGYGANQKSREILLSPLCKIVQSDESDDEETIKELRIPGSVASMPSKCCVQPKKLIEEL